MSIDEARIVLNLVMIAPIQLQCIFSFIILANPEVESHAPNTYQSKPVVLLIATNVMDKHLHVGHE